MIKNIINFFRRNLLECKEDYKIISYRFHERCWGNDFNLSHKYDEEGNCWSIALWNKHAPSVGDVLLLGIEPKRYIGYKIYKVRPCRDPMDMYFVDARFVKRETYAHKLEEKK